MEVVHEIVSAEVEVEYVKVWNSGAVGSMLGIRISVVEVAELWPSLSVAWIINP